MVDALDGGDRVEPGALKGRDERRLQLRPGIEHRCREHVAGDPADGIKLDVHGGYCKSSTRPAHSAHVAMRDASSAGSACPARTAARGHGSSGSGKANVSPGTSDNTAGTAGSARGDDPEGEHLTCADTEREPRARRRGPRLRGDDDDRGARIRPRAASGAHPRRMRNHGAPQAPAAGHRRRRTRRRTGVRRAGRCTAAGTPCPGQALRLHSGMRRHPSGAESRLPRTDDPHPHRRRHPRPGNHGAGCDRTPPPQPGRGARGVDRRSMGARHGPGGEPLRARPPAPMSISGSPRPGARR